MTKSNYLKELEQYEEDVAKEGTFETVSSLCDVFWAWRMINWPEFASFCGYHEFDDRLNDNSLEAIQAKENKAAEFLAHCQKLIDRGGLNSDDSFNVFLLREELKLFVEGSTQKAYLFPVSYMEGLHVDFEQLTSWMLFNNDNDYDMYIKRVEAIAPRLQQDIALMKEGIRLGKVFNHHSMKGVMESCDVIINVQHPEATVMYEPFKSMPDCIEEEKKTEYREKALHIIETSVVPAFVKLRIFVENDYIPKCRPAEGVYTMEGGEEFYRQCLKFHLSMDIPPKDIHELGRREVYRIQQQMKEICTKLNFKGELRDFLQHLRTHQDFFYETKEEILEAYEDICFNKIRPKLSQLFNKIPESKLTIMQTPESRAAGPAAFYLAGTLDGSRPGIYYVNSHNSKMNGKYKMMCVSLHEGEPGHHFQGMYMLESKELPEFRKNMEDMLYAQAPSRFGINTAYVEGWGLYCEYLGIELGLYEDDPYSMFGYLSFEMMRACRLVVDTGIHSMGWSYEKAVKLFQENCAMVDEDIRNEVKRYITWPGQALGYKIGQLKIKELRKRAEDKLGDKFDVKQFHEVVLKCGSVPLTVLESVVNKMIEQSK